MSHAYLMVLMPTTEIADDTGKVDKRRLSKQVDNYLERIMAFYDENMSVPEYEHTCYCVGRQAQQEAYKESEKKFGDIDTIRTNYWKLPEAERDQDGKWEEMLHKNEREKLEQEFIASHPLKDTANSECGECHGTGKVKSTYNPNSKWDWYVIGGRWDGTIKRTPRDDGNGGFNFGDQHHQLEHNMVVVKDLLPLTNGDFPFALLTPDGKWHEKGEMGWFGMARNEKPTDNWHETVKELLLAHQDHLAIGVDYHI